MLNVDIINIYCDELKVIKHLLKIMTQYNFKLDEFIFL